MAVRELTAKEAAQLDQPKVRELSLEEFSQLEREFGSTPPSNPNAIQAGSPQAAQASHPVPEGYASGMQSVGPATGPIPTPAQRSAGDAELAAYQAQKIKQQTGSDIRGPWMNRAENQEPIRDVGLGVATGLATGGASVPISVGRLAMQALAQGGAAATSEAIGQRESGVSNPGQIAKEAAYTAAGDFAGGTLLKTIGKIANKIFVTPMDEQTGKAAQFARDQGRTDTWGGLSSKPNAFFPLSSAMPGSKPGMVQGASNILLPGQLKNMSDAKQVAVFLNQKIGTMQQDPNVIKAAADQGQKFLRTVFEPGETVYTKTFENFRGLVGDDTPIPLVKSSVAIQDAAEALALRGANGPIAKRLYAITGVSDKTASTISKLDGKIADYRSNLRVLDAKRTPENKALIDAQMDKWEGKIVEAKRLAAEAKGRVLDTLTAKEADELYTGLLKQASKDGEARGEMGQVLKALETDLDATGKQYGANFLEDATAMKAQRDNWRELRKVPGLERLSKELGTPEGAQGSNTWLDGLFVNPNGKALAKFRELQPDLYHDVADAWLGKELNRFSRPTGGNIGKVLDGRALRTWYTANTDRIKLIYGAPQAQALDNFSLYAHYMAKAGNDADTKVLGGKELTGRMLGEAAAITGLKIPGMPIPGAPLLVIPGEGAAFLLARGLSDPSSSLFKIFTQGFDPKTRQFMLMTGQLGGRETGRANTN